MRVLAAAAGAGHPLWHYAGFLIAPLMAALALRRPAPPAVLGGSLVSTLASSARSWWVSARSADPRLQALAAASALVAGIHISVCLEHFQEATAYGVFFALLATFQLAWGAVVLARPTRTVLLFGASVNAATVGLWLVSRTVGLPVGPETWSPEEFGRLDIAASAVELAVVPACVLLARVLPRGRALRWRPAAHGLRALLPQGTPLPEKVWAQRHRWISAVLWIHLPGIAIFALARSRPVWEAMLIPGLLVPFGIAARTLRGHRRAATVVTAVGLLTCSAELVWLSGGATEMHFHYFVMVGIITLYQDWWPFLVAIGYVVLQHGVAGVLAPSVVFDHQSAIDDPWKWAAIHGVFVLAMSGAGMASWRLNEAFLRSVKDGQDDLRRTLSLLSATLDATADGILVVDSEGRITSHNRRFAELWGIPDEVLATRDDDRALSFVLRQLSDPESFIGKVRELYAQPGESSQDVLHFRDGRTVDRFSTPQRVDGAIVGRVWSFRDVTEQRRLEQELAHQAFHDSLTGLANQALFRDRVNHSLARLSRRGGPLAVLFLDLDGFKNINDSLGHTAGDELLTSMAERVQGCLRVTDTAARLGGDEFAVLLEDLTSEHEATVVAQRIISALLRPFRPAGREVVIGASIGIAFGSVGISGDQLLRNADLAMYTAKRHHRGGYQIFRSDMHTRALDRLELEVDLRRGLGRDELEVAYQPIVTADGSVIAGVEALVRWRHPTRGVLAPGSFITLAEETGLIREIGRQVLNRACQQTREWQRAGLGADELTVSVNISPGQLYHDEIVDEVREALESSGLAPACLTLEITETGMMTDSERAIRKLHELKALGVRLAVDDFGTGYSSLSYLERFPVDILKIDRSFVAPIGDGEGESSLASAIVSLARTMRLTAVAEGVETRQQAEVLAGLGCDYAQGYYFSRPVDAPNLRALLESRRAEDITVVGGPGA
jgi:diguanylate cyclase (GGDEF)-like protein/PAS domain S-box-containing protein